MSRNCPLRRQVEKITTKLAKALKITGPYNMQLIAKDGEVKVSLRCYSEM